MKIEELKELNNLYQEYAKICNRVDVLTRDIEGKRLVIALGGNYFSLSPEEKKLLLKYNTEIMDEISKKIDLLKVEGLENEIN